MSTCRHFNSDCTVDYIKKICILTVLTLPDSGTLPSVTDTRQRQKNTRQIVGRVQHSAKRTRPFFYRRSRLCRVPFLGHSANLCRVPSRTRQKKLKRDGRTAELANGTANWRTGRPNGTGRKLCRVPYARHSAKIQTSPSANLAALGEVWVFAECQASGTRRSLGLCRVPVV